MRHCCFLSILASLYYLPGIDGSKSPPFTNLRVNDVILVIGGAEDTAYNATLDDVDKDSSVTHEEDANSNPMSLRDDSIQNDSEWNDDNEQDVSSVIQLEMERTDLDNDCRISCNDDDDYNDDDANDMSEGTSLNVIREKAAEYRKSGKLSHDNGDYADAAVQFQNAAHLLETMILNNRNPTFNDAAAITDKNDTFSDDEKEGEDFLSSDWIRELAEEAATCRLHQALCDWKQGSDGEVEKCVETCSIVLNDYQTLIQDNDTADVQFINTHTIYSQHTLSAPLLARAHLRRAKGRLSLGLREEALEDARAAAFLGDRSAVTLYGRLMRVNSSTSSSSSLLDENKDNDNNAWHIPTFGSSISGNGANPFMSNLDSTSTALSDGLFSSLLSSTTTNNHNPFANMLLNGIGNQENDNSLSNKHNNSGGMDSLAKSILSSLMEKIDNEETQEMICTFLNAASEEQISQYASLAGIPLSGDHVSKLASITTSITQQKLKRGVSLTKRAIKVGNVIRKILKVVFKYRHFIVYYFLFVWIRSAILRPLPTKTVK